MSADKFLSQRDLELLDDKDLLGGDASESDAGGAENKAAAGDKEPAGDKGAEQPVDKGAQGKDDKAAGKEGNDDLFDTGDDAGGDKKAAVKDDKKADIPADKSAADGDDKGKKDDKAAADTGGNWRAGIADKLLAKVKDTLSVSKYEKRHAQIIKQLERSKSIEDAAVSGILAQEKLRAGNKIPDDADEAAAWRKANDVPESPDKYEIPQIAGHKWTDADTPHLDNFKEFAHSKGLSQGLVNEIIDYYVKRDQGIATDYDANLKKVDKEDKEACHDAIRTEFGVPEFKSTVAVMKRLMEDDEVFGGQENAEILASARYFDKETGQWRRLLSRPSIARGFIGLATDRYGDGPAPSGDARSGGGADRLAEIDKIMQTDINRYYKEGLADEAMKIRQDQEQRAAKRAARR